jgi:8-amino-7-oxononanoate synthase
MFDNFLSQKLDAIEKSGLCRQLRQGQSNSCAHICINGKDFINFSSNNYLDLAGNEEISLAARQACKKYGVGATSSRLVGGNIDIHQELETALARFKNSQSCLVFPSGYQANVGVISAVASKTDNACIIMDKLSHASIWDGAKLSGARIFVYEHCDMDSFEAVLKRAESYKLKFAVTESVFSMDGDLTPLKEFAQLCIKYGAVSVVDEAHSTGVFGKHGKSLASHFGVADKIDITIGTLSKAFGAQGGFVCGSQKLIDFLINKSRAFIYTTAISPIICAAVLKSLEILQHSDDKREILFKNAAYLRQSLQELGFNIGKSQSQIIPIIIGETKKTKETAERLFKNLILAPDIKPPTVLQGCERIRISLTSGHTFSDIDKLIEAL